MRRLVLLFLLAAACATTHSSDRTTKSGDDDDSPIDCGRHGPLVTPYQEDGLRGGYSDSSVAPGVFRVDVRGNAYAGLDLLRCYALRRGLELCQDAGFPHVRLVSGDDSSTMSYDISGGGGFATVSPVEKHRLSVVAACMTQAEFDHWTARERERLAGERERMLGVDAEGK